MTDGRSGVPRTGAGERDMPRAHLGVHRDTLAPECAGLPDDGVRRRGPSLSAASG